MKKKVALIGLLLASAAFGGCTVFPTTMEEPGSILRSWGRDLSDLQIAIDKHFLNYDYYDWFND